MAKKKGALSEEAAREEKIRQLQQKEQHDKDVKADRDRMEMLETMKNDAKNSMLARKEKRRHDEMLRQFEIDKQMQREQEESKINSKRRRNNLIQKKEQEHDYYNFLSHQAQEKRNKRTAEIQADKQFVQAERAKLTVEANNREKYFDKLRVCLD